MRTNQRPPNHYQRRERDRYLTPAWVTATLIGHLPGGIGSVLEPACANGQMVRELMLKLPGVRVQGSDIVPGLGFLQRDFLLDPVPACDAIITNPPYTLAREFLERALEHAGVVAMLLSSDYDYAKTRAHLFSDCPAFARKISIRGRIRWIEGTKGNPRNYHAWYLWDRGHVGPAGMFWV